MSSLIPFQNRPDRAVGERTEARGEATIVDVASHATHTRTASSRRRPRRNWDPAFHVDLLTF